MDLTAAKIAESVHRTRLMDLEYHTRIRALVDRVATERWVFGVVRSLRDLLLVVPTRHAYRFVGLKDESEAHNVLDDLVRELITELDAKKVEIDEESVPGTAASGPAAQESGASTRSGQKRVGMGGRKPRSVKS